MGHVAQEDNVHETEHAPAADAAQDDVPTFTDRLRSRGATAVEYALIVALIAAIIIGIVATLGKKVSENFGKTETEWSKYD